MAATSVIIPMADIHMAGILPPSAIKQKPPRHGRIRGASFSNGKSVKGRPYSLIDDRRTAVSKAVVFVLKRVGKEGKEDKEGKENKEDKEDKEGKEDKENKEDKEDKEDKASEPSDDESRPTENWVDVDVVLQHPKVAALGATRAELQELAAAGKGRLSIRANTGTAAGLEISRWRQTTAAWAGHEAKTSLEADFQPVQADDDDLPAFVVYETSYPKYHLILASGSIERAGGQPYLAFRAVQADPAAAATALGTAASVGAVGGAGAGLHDDSTMALASDADVSIWVDLRAALATGSGAATSWWRRRADNGSSLYVTADAVPTAVWSKAVARRGDLGVLFKDGEVRREVPVGLRGKGAKAKKGRGVLKSRGTAAEDIEDSSGSASE